MKEPCVFTSCFLGVGAKGRFAVEASGGFVGESFFKWIRVVQVILFEKNKAQDLYRRRAPWSFPSGFFSGRFDSDGV